MSLGALLKMVLGSYICSSPNSVIYTGCTGYGGVLVKPGQKTGLCALLSSPRIININALLRSGALEKLISAPFMLLDSLKAGPSSSMHQAPMWGILHRTPPAVTFQLGDKDFVNRFESFLQSVSIIYALHTTLAQLLPAVSLSKRPRGLLDTSDVIDTSSAPSTSLNINVNPHEPQCQPSYIPLTMIILTTLPFIELPWTLCVMHLGT
ncbi:hypothetical protein F4604DRAFT_1686450 [Suillus subluteus]|nr:hypothetical protein F4604DRAFT_1686450 [Suillus subluteus]